MGTVGLSIPIAVLDAWGLEPHVVECQPLSGGLSGALVFRVLVRREIGVPQNVVVRGWPEGISSDRVQDVQRFVSAVRQAGCALVPQWISSVDGASYLTHQQRIWEVTEWIEGEPWRPQTLTHQELSEAVHKGAAAIGQVHAAANQQTLSEAARQAVVPPAVLERCQRLQVVQDWWEAGPLDANRLDGREWLGAADRVARACWQTHGQAIAEWLTTARTIAHPVRTVLRDVHEQHVLFQDAQVSGIIDFDAMRIDTPAVDLSRFAHGFLLRWGIQKLASNSSPLFQMNAEWGDCLEKVVWPAALAGYRQHCSFSEQEAELARHLGDVSSLFSLVNWVVWISWEEKIGRLSEKITEDVARNRVEQLQQFAINYFLAR